MRHIVSTFVVVVDPPLRHLLRPSSEGHKMRCISSWVLADKLAPNPHTVPIIMVRSHAVTRLHPLVVSLFLKGTVNEAVARWQEDVLESKQALHRLSYFCVVVVVVVVVHFLSSDRKIRRTLLVSNVLVFGRSDCGS